MQEDNFSNPASLHIYLLNKQLFVIHSKVNIFSSRVFRILFLII